MPNDMHFCRPWRKHVQSFKKTDINLHEELQSQGTRCLYIWSENEKVHKVEKVTKTNARIMIISKAYAHHHNMGKTCEMFQKD